MKNLGSDTTPTTTIVNKENDTKSLKPTIPPRQRPTPLPRSPSLSTLNTKPIPTSRPPKLTTSQGLSAQQNQSHDRRTDVICLLYTSPSPRDATLSRMPSSA